jgi:hypothetical protein
MCAVNFGAKLMEMLGEGLDNFGPQVSEELSRLGKQGAMESASLIFNGSAFVPYGPGAYSKEQEQAGMETEGIQPPQIELDTGRDM